MKEREAAKKAAKAEAAAALRQETANMVSAAKAAAALKHAAARAAIKNVSTAKDDAAAEKAKAVKAAGEEWRAHKAAQEAKNRVKFELETTKGAESFTVLVHEKCAFSIRALSCETRVETGACVCGRGSNRRCPFQGAHRAQILR